MASSNTRDALLNEKPFKLMLSLSIPAILGMVVIGLYNFMDSVFVGRMVSENAMAAISIAYPFTLINSGISTLIGMGSASVLSRAIGKKDQKTVDKIMGNLIVIVFILSIISTLIGCLFTEQLLTLSGASGETFELASRYLKIVFIGSVFVNFSQSANMVMRGEGLLKKAMLIMALGAILNIILDPILIALLNSSGKGIEGAAYATVIAQIIQAIITLVYFTTKSQNVKINSLRLDGAILKEVLGVGVSGMMMQVLTLVQQTLLFNVAAQYGGETAQIILAPLLRIQSFTFIPLWGISQGFQPVAGTNYGAKQYDRVKEVTKVFMVSATVLAAVFYIPIMCFPSQVISMFNKNMDIVAQSVGPLRIFYSIYIAFGMMIIAITLFQALGKAGYAALLSMCRQIILYIPLLLLMPKIGDLGLTGVWLAPTITDIIVSVIAIVLVLKEFKGLSKQKKQVAYSA